MIYVYSTLLILFNGCCVASVLLTLPGNWLMLAATYLFAWRQWDRGIFGWPLLITVTVLALLGELVEFFAGAGGAKKAGSSWPGAVAAIAGGILGALIGTAIVPLLGTLLGAAFGAGLLTWTVERMTGSQNAPSIRSGIGAGRGVLVGILAKFTAGCLIWLLITIAVFW